MAQKDNYARRGQEMAASFSALTDGMLAFRNIWWDRGYNTGGASPLTDEDVAVLGLSAADVTGLITFADALETFLAANRAYLSKMRNDL
jgi:hypothetical protein